MAKRASRRGEGLARGGGEGALRARAARRRMGRQTCARRSRRSRRRSRFERTAKREASMSARAMIASGERQEAEELARRKSGVDHRAVRGGGARATAMAETTSSRSAPSSRKRSRRSRRRSSLNGALGRSRPRLPRSAESVRGHRARPRRSELPRRLALVEGSRTRRNVFARRRRPRRSCGRRDDAHADFERRFDKRSTSGRRFPRLAREREPPLRRRADPRPSLGEAARTQDGDAAKEPGCPRPKTRRRHGSRARPVRAKRRRRSRRRVRGRPSGSPRSGIQDAIRRRVTREETILFPRRVVCVDYYRTRRTSTTRATTAATRPAAFPRPQASRAGRRGGRARRWRGLRGRSAAKRATRGGVEASSICARGVMSTPRYDAAALAALEVAMEEVHDATSSPGSTRRGRRGSRPESSPSPSIARVVRAEARSTRGWRRCAPSSGRRRPRQRSRRCARPRRPTTSLALQWRSRRPRREAEYGAAAEDLAEGHGLSPRSTRRGRRGSRGAAGRGRGRWRSDAAGGAAVAALEAVCARGVEATCARRSTARGGRDLRGRRRSSSARSRGGSRWRALEESRRGRAAAGGGRGRRGRRAPRRRRGAGGGGGGGAEEEEAARRRRRRPRRARRPARGGGRGRAAREAEEAEAASGGGGARPRRSGGARALRGRGGGARGGRGRRARRRGGGAARAREEARIEAEERERAKAEAAAAAAAPRRCATGTGPPRRTRRTRPATRRDPPATTPTRWRRRRSRRRPTTTRIRGRRRRRRRRRRPRRRALCGRGCAATPRGVQDRGEAGRRRHLPLDARADRRARRPAVAARPRLPAAHRRRAGGADVARRRQGDDPRRGAGARARGRAARGRGRCRVCRVRRGLDGEFAPTPRGGGSVAERGDERRAEAAFASMQRLCAESQRAQAEPLVCCDAYRGELAEIDAGLRRRGGSARRAVAAAAATRGSRPSRRRTGCSRPLPRGAGGVDAERGGARAGRGAGTCYPREEPGRRIHGAASALVEGRDGQIYLVMPAVWPKPMRGHTQNEGRGLVAPLIDANPECQR